MQTYRLRCNNGGYIFITNANKQKRLDMGMGITYAVPNWLQTSGKIEK